MKTKFEETIIELEKGEIPEDLETKTEIAAQITLTERYGFSASAIMLASARRDNFKNRKDDWIKWADKYFDLDISARSHKNKFGMILLSIPEANNLDYKRLFNLDSHKAIAISRFVRKENLDEVKSTEIKTILTFLCENNLEHMTRDEVREKVEEKLEEISGIKKEPQKVEIKAIQPELTGFKESIDNIFSKIDKDNISNFVDTLNHDEAKKTTCVAMTCLKAVSDYYRKADNYKLLNVQEMNDLEAFANRLSKQFGSWREALGTTLNAG